MKWFLDFTTRSKLYVSFGLMIASLGAVIAIAHSGISAIQESQKTLYQESFANVHDLMELRTNQNGVRAALLTMMALTQRADQEAWQQDISGRSREMGSTMQRLLERNRSNPYLSVKLEELNKIREDFTQTRETIIQMVYAGKTDQARVLALGIQDERYRKMRAIAMELENKAEEQARAAVAESEQRTRETVRQFVIIGIVAIGLALMMALVMDHIIAEPLRTVSGIAERVAAGDLTVKVPQEARADELGILMRTFRAMVESLRQSTQEIHEGVNMLASGASQILATTTQFAAGAAQTSSAVSETTVTVEEVKQTAQMASKKAKHVSESAQKALQFSQAGSKSVGEAIEGMQRVQEQMESIAESIVHLSEQSQAIGEIIATVNDLAEQSNLLAVNAAIEANKAGEHGKGFVIVAQEIKSLAGQSRQASAQVRVILGDIQKATSAAVLATEQGNKAVEAGVRQSAGAGESIRLLTDSIVSEAAQAAVQIAASSQQQMVGMDQVALAMDNIKQASMQSVSGARQAENAAKSLNELGQKLRQMAERYKV